jgi:PKD repeat protein
MKKIYLLTAALMIGVLSFAQQYTVNVCGNIENSNGASATLDLLYWGSSSGQLSASSDSIGDYCVTLYLAPDSGNFANLGFSIYQTNCLVVVGDTLNDIWINSDTTITLNLSYCGGDVSVTPPQNCTATISDSTAGIYAYGNGIAPFSYHWSNGEITSSIAVADSGVYCVTITDADSCVSSACYTMSGGNNIPSCEVSIASYPDSSGVNLISFYAYPNGVAPFTYTWSFSDGAVSNDANPTHTFIQGQGWDWTCLDVTDATGCVASYCDYVEITSVDSTIGATYCNADFMAYFDDVSGTAGEVSFYDYSYASNNIVSWSWDFGDGNTSVTQNPTHTYTSADYYTVCLTTTDSDGCVSTTCQTCYIDPVWWTSNPWNIDAGSCVADFVVGQDANVPGIVYLVDLSLGSNLYYTWEFGSGTIINDQYPFVNFMGTGVYDFCLTVTDTISGCTDSFCDQVGFDANDIFVGKTGTWGVSVIPSPRPRSTTGVKEIVNEEKTFVSLYPNPASNILNLNVSLVTDQRVTVSIVDVTGKEVATSFVNMNKGINTYSVETNHLSKGMYFVNVSSEVFNTSQRLVIQH